MTDQSSPLNLALFDAALQTRALGRAVIYEDSVSSTMDLARAAASDGAAHGTIVFAEEQTAGRGRRGRSFFSPAKQNLYFTFVLRLPLAIHRRLPVILPVAVARAIRDTGLDARIKWPNDIWLSNRKVCGMLIDGELTREGGLAFPGIGINVNGDPGANPDLAGLATSIAVELGHDVSRESVLASVCNHLESLLDDPTPDLVDEYRALSCTLDREVTVAPAGADSYLARALSISDDGELMVRRANGLVVAVNAADVSIRPSESAQGCGVRSRKLRYLA
jgi:BirA family biotin operon repressor/biotin-[acetyl-CoA-carboxylase] ligase